MTVPERYDLKHYRGDTFGMMLRLWQTPTGQRLRRVRAAGDVPVDLTGATVAAQVRKTATDTVVAATFTVAVTGNEITLTLPPSTVTALPAAGVYDVQVDWASDGTRVQTVLAGALTITDDVTRVTP